MEECLHKNVTNYAGKVRVEKEWIERLGYHQKVDSLC